MSINRNLTSSPLSSAQSSQATFQTASSHSKPRFRETQPLPFEILQQVKVYLEESLFTQGLRFVQGLISPVAADPKKVVPIPPPQYLALLATLTVHPSFTSRASTTEKSSQSHSAFKLLRTIDLIAGPVNTSITEAYRFRRYDSLPSTSSRRRRNQDDTNDDIDSSHEDNPTSGTLNSIYADEESLFSLAEDFWSVTGWALNCSCTPGPLYAARWKYLAPWLEYMLDLLETDWELREETDSLNHSLLFEYIKSAIGGNVRGRRILRAIFADGSAAAQKEFREIFRKELKEPKSERDRELEREKKEAKKEVTTVDVDNEIYGDWMKDEDTSTDEDDPATKKRDDFRAPSGRPAKRLRTRTPRTSGKRSLLHQQQETDDSDASAQDEGGASGTGNVLGGPKSISIRLRFLQLLSTFAAGLSLMTPNPEPIFPDLHELYTLFVEFIRPLPLSTFQSIVLSSGYLTERGLQTESRIALCEFILQRLVDSDSENQGISTFQPMTQERFVKDYLPYTALKNSIEAQAKISLLVESILRQLADGKNGVLRRTPDLVEAVRAGIDKRLAKASEISESVRGRRGNEKEADLALDMLKESGTRMKFVVENFIDD